MQQTGLLTATLPYLKQRVTSLVWSCLDAELYKSAVFWSERYFGLDKNDHDARHLYALSLLRAGQICSALGFVNVPPDRLCSGCCEIKSKCLAALGRHREARQALEDTFRDQTYTPTPSTAQRTAKAFPDEAALKCRAGIMALKGNLPEKAATSFRHALAMNPYLWEAWEGLCALGMVPQVDEIFPPRAAPVRQMGPDDSANIPAPAATGGGFFTPDGGSNGNIFRGWGLGANQPQPFRMAPSGPRDSLTSNDTSLDNSFLQLPQKNGRAGPSNMGTNSLLATSRPLSSADESGPVHKKPRSTARQREETAKPKPLKLGAEEPSKKARDRPALTLANIFSSTGRREQPARSTSNGPAKSNQPAVNVLATRRSTRLLSTGTKPAAKPARDRRKPAAPAARAESVESDMDDDPGPLYAGSPPSHASPRSEASMTSNWTALHDQAAQDTYDQELAEDYLYDLLRRFAKAMRHMAVFQCTECIQTMGLLTNNHQQTPWVLALIGRAHYEDLNYSAAERAFTAVRALDPNRLWDMEVYSTLLWHLQKNVQLSFLSQELLNIDPQSPQAWIAVGNLFSLQRERSQALTCFRRAAQMDPGCAYAYTLSGHESIDEDLEKAINFFQSAVRADSRHYNAWYGLGTCYLRMSKVRLAEYHYRRAMSIHPANAVLLGCVGMTVERRGDRAGALALFNQAVEITPDNPLVRYRRAKLLIIQKQYALAVEDLETLLKSSPDESNVIFQLARVYRLIGNVHKSAEMLAVVRDKSPKNITKFKKLLETVKDETGDESRMDEG